MSHDLRVEPTADALWRDHYPALRMFCVGLVGPDVADDVATDAFMACRARLASGAVNDERAYLYRAAVNVSRQWHRSRSREQRRMERVAGRAVTAEVSEVADVRRAIRLLSERQRAVLFLVYWEDLTEARAAEVLGVHVGTVRRHLNRAHAHLRRVLT